jgi:hypothetical protein
MSENVAAKIKEFIEPPKVVAVFGRVVGSV